MRRPRSITPEDRAAALSEQGYMASGTSYISVVMREDNKQDRVPYYRNKRGRVPYYRNPEKCEHGVSMCPTWECIESWSLDYEVNLPLTVAGRELASRLGIDGAKFALAKRDGIELLKQEDFRIEQGVR